MSTQKVSRPEVYEAIDSERDYQNKWATTLSGNRPAHPGVPGMEPGDRTVDEYALYIVGYADDLLHEGAHFSVTEKKLEIMRKIAGLCVACMEQHGAPKRSTQPVWTGCNVPGCTIKEMHGHALKC